jgi:hypothetical protein
MIILSNDGASLFFSKRHYITNMDYSYDCHTTCYNVLLVLVMITYGSIDNWDAPIFSKKIYSLLHYRCAADS